MKLSVVVPVRNQLNDCKGILRLLTEVTTGDDWELVIIDDGSTEPVEEFVRKFLKPKRLNYVRNSEPRGVFGVLQQAYEVTNSEILAVFHNDVYIYESGWNRRVIRIFDEHPNIGMAGFFGSQGVYEGGGRLNMFSNMLEAEAHGSRLKDSYKPAAVFDGFSMIFRREMLDLGKGFDQSYKYHHFYDVDASLESLRRGYDNAVIDVACHHISGLTANRPEYQGWINQKLGVKENGDKKTHEMNQKRFNEKWGKVMPILVKDDFSMETEPGELPQLGLKFDFKGDAIRKMK